MGDPGIARYRRARSALESRQRPPAEKPAADLVSADLTQVVLDTAEWLRTLWEVGYMGQIRSRSPAHAFPLIEVEDVLNRSCSSAYPPR